MLWNHFIWVHIEIDVLIFLIRCDILGSLIYWSMYFNFWRVEECGNKKTNVCQPLATRAQIYCATTNIDEEYSGGTLISKAPC